VRTFRKIAGVMAAALTLVSLAACDSVQADAGKVASSLTSLPSVESAAGDGNGMQLNRDAKSLVSVVVSPGAPLTDIETLVSEWYSASGELPSTALVIAMPATEVDGDHVLQIARSSYAEQDLPAVVDGWYSLTESYSLVTREVQSVANAGDPYGVTTIVAADATSPSQIADVAAELAELGDDPGMTWWLHSAVDDDAATMSITAFSRNELPDEHVVSLLVGFDDAYARAEVIGGMNLEVASNYDGVYQVRANINADSLREVAEADLGAQLETSDAWVVVRSMASVVDPAASVDITFSVLGYDAFAELDTVDCSKQTYAQYALLGPAVYAEWPGTC
jgi:hypothetical protein